MRYSTRAENTALIFWGYNEKRSFFFFFQIYRQKIGINLLKLSHVAEFTLWSWDRNRSVHLCICSYIFMKVNSTFSMRSFFHGPSQQMHSIVKITWGGGVFLQEILKNNPYARISDYQHHNSVILKHWWIVWWSICFCQFKKAWSFDTCQLSSISPSICQIVGVLYC